MTILKDEQVIHNTCIVQWTQAMFHVKEKNSPFIQRQSVYSFSLILIGVGLKKITKMKE